MRRHATSATPQALAAYLDDARQALGGVDVFIHNASALAVGPDLASWEASLQVDLLAAARACERVLPWMQESGGGAILFVSSIAAFDASPMPDYGYSSAKAALNTFAKKLAITQAAHGIRANVIAPGSIEFEGGVWAHVKQHNPPLYAATREFDPLGTDGYPRGGGRRGRLPRLSAGELGHGRDARGGRRPAQGHSMSLKPWRSRAASVPKKPRAELRVRCSSFFVAATPSASLRRSPSYSMPM
jgi:NAD(P)-dependent dehydrogenase (short-subunit alcohol dehydrogenase family)